MPEINLLENRLRDTTNARERQIKIGLVILSVILVAILTCGVILYLLNKTTEKSLENVSSENKVLQKKLSDIQQTLGAAKTYQAQLQNLDMLLKEHVYLIPLFDELSKFTYIKAQYGSFDVENKDGRIHLLGQVSSYKDLGKLMLGLSTSSVFKDVKLLSITSADDEKNSFKFSIDMSVATQIFYPNLK